MKKTVFNKMSNAEMRETKGGWGVCICDRLTLDCPCICGGNHNPNPGGGFPGGNPDDNIGQIRP